MASRFAGFIPRLVALTAVWLLAASAVTFAAGGGKSKDRSVPPPRTSERTVLVVPDVRRQAYVFAKGILSDGGFGWRVKGEVEGYAANVVAAQYPAPDVRVVDTGAPTIVLTLERNLDYPESGLPENTSPQRGTKLVLVSELEKRKPPRKESGKAKSKGKKTRARENGKPAKERTSGKRDSTRRREPAFRVPGAPREPADEIPLPARARLLEKRVEAATRRTPALVRYWLYQHAWVVTGARFGWSGGAEALRILIRLDEKMESRFGIGARSAGLARAALAEVERKSRR